MYYIVRYENADWNKVNCKDADRLFVKRLCNNAALPKRGRDESAGYDLSASQECVISEKGKGIVKNWACYLIFIWNVCENSTSFWIGS